MPSDLRAELDALLSRKPAPEYGQHEWIRGDWVAALTDLAERLLTENEGMRDVLSRVAYDRGYQPEDGHPDWSHIDPLTSTRAVNVDLMKRIGEAARLGKLLDEAVSAITWMSGASDFNPDGQAGEAFRRDVLPLVDRIEQERDAK